MKQVDILNQFIYKIKNRIILTKQIIKDEKKILNILSTKNLNNHLEQYFDTLYKICSINFNLITCSIYNNKFFYDNNIYELNIEDNMLYKKDIIDQKKYDMDYLTIYNYILQTNNDFDVYKTYLIFLDKIKYFKGSLLLFDLYRNGYSLNEQSYLELKKVLTSLKKYRKTKNTEYKIVSCYYLNKLRNELKKVDPLYLIVDKELFYFKEFTNINFIDFFENEIIKLNNQNTDLKLDIKKEIQKDLINYYRKEIINICFNQSKSIDVRYDEKEKRIKNKLFKYC